MAGTGIEHVAHCAATMCDQLETMFGDGFRIGNVACVVEVVVEGEKETRVIHLTPGGADNGISMLVKAAAQALGPTPAPEVRGPYADGWPDGGEDGDR
jgi:hypothetical protein